MIIIPMIAIPVISDDIPPEDRERISLDWHDSITKLKQQSVIPDEQKRIGLEWRANVIESKPDSLDELVSKIEEMGLWWKIGLYAGQYDADVIIPDNWQDKNKHYFEIDNRGITEVFEEAGFGKVSKHHRVQGKGTAVELLQMALSMAIDELKAKYPD